jgi:methylmalonyl-CoA/ethylmalonyl-CoA epimerase
MAIEIKGLGQVAVSIQDIERAIAFYRDTLGLKFLFRAGHLAFFDLGGVRLMLSPPERDHKEFSSVLYFRVSHIQKAYAQLKAEKVEFVGAPNMIARMPDHELWLAEFKDGEGNFMALMSEVRPPSA